LQRVTPLQYPTAPTLAGVNFRHAVMPDDLRGMNEVANAARFADGSEWVTSHDQFRAHYEHLVNCDPATDIVVAERDGRLVADGRASWRQEPDGTRLYEPTVFARPEEGPALLDALMEAMERRCRQIAATHPPGPRWFDTESMDRAAARVDMLNARGYEPARYFFAMVRPNLDDLPDAALPKGVETRPVTPDQLRPIFDAEGEAMSDGWGYAVPTEADYEHFLTDPVQGDYTLWQVAWDGDQVAGMVRGYINREENEFYRRKRGYVENISTRRPWRRRGLARALIGATMRVLRERGMTEGALGVDTQNPSGALHLYESCGFVRQSRNAIYRKPLD
jgi:mycothiol synthase